MLPDLYKKFKALPKKDKQLYVLLSSILFTFWLYLYIHTPPVQYPLNEVITIENGESLQDITASLQNENVIS